MNANMIFFVINGAAFALACLITVYQVIRDGFVRYLSTYGQLPDATTDVELDAKNLREWWALNPDRYKLFQNGFSYKKDDETHYGKISDSTMKEYHKWLVAMAQDKEEGAEADAAAKAANAANQSMRDFLGVVQEDIDKIREQSQKEVRDSVQESITIRKRIEDEFNIKKSVPDEMESTEQLMVQEG